MQSENIEEFLAIGVLHSCVVPLAGIVHEDIDRSTVLQCPDRRRSDKGARH